MSRDRTITDEMASLIKGMLLRGDDQSDIAACFLVNGGRISEINTGKRFAEVSAAEGYELPPRDFPSPYELLRAKASMRAAADSIRANIEREQTTLAMIDRVLK